MQITVETSALVDAVSWAQKSIAPRPTTPILSGVMLSAKDGVLTISGFDGVSASTATLAAGIDGPGVCLLPATVFAGIIKSFPRGKTLTLTVGERAVIQCGSAKFTAQVMPLTDYPTLPILPPKLGTVPGGVFTTSSSQVTFAACRDTSLPALTGVSLRVEDRLSLMATDRYRLAFATVDYAREGDNSLSLLVPATVVDNVARMNAGEVEIFGDDSRAGFRCGNRATVTSLIAEQYPKIMSLFPEYCPNTAVVSVRDLLEVLTRASNVTETNLPVKLTFTETELTVNSGTQNGATGQETIACETNSEGGEPIVCGFNVHYLIESLKTLTTEKVEFGFQQNIQKPALIREPEAFDAKQLVMPVRLDSV